MAKTPAKKAPTKSKAKISSFPELSFGNSFWKRHWKEALLIVALAFAVYGISIPYGYVLDDQIVISNNNFTKKGIDGIGEILSTESFTGYFGKQKDLVAGARYRPLSIVTFAIEQSLFGENEKALPHIQHAVNILFYALLGLLIFRIAALLIKTKENGQWWMAIPFIASILYLLHPVHTEVVANIKGRDEIMTSIGAMGALYFALRYLPSRNILWLILSGVSMFLGLMSKENALTFLAVIPLTLYFFTSAKTKDYVATIIPSVVASLIYIIIRTNVIGYLLDSGKRIDDLMNDPFLEMNGMEKLATIMFTLLKYLQLLIFPHPLTHDYYPYKIPIMNFGSLGTIAAVLVYAGLVYVFFRYFKSKSIYAWAIGFFLATISIVSNLVFPVGTFMNERFIFLPSIAFSIVCGYTLIKYGWQSEKPALKFGSLAVLGLLVAGYAFKSLTRIPVWESGNSLNKAAIEISSESARANTFMGTTLFEEAKTTEDHAKKVALYAEAEKYIDRSLAIYPRYLSANQMKSGLAAERYHDHRDLNVLLGDFEAILRRRPEVEYIRQYLEYLNGRADQETLTNWYYRVAYEHLGVRERNYPWAIAILNIGEKGAPNDWRILYALGKSYMETGDTVRGNQYLERAYANNPALRGQ